MRSDMKWVLGDHRGSRVSGPRKGQRFSPAEFRKHDWDIDDTQFVAGVVGHGLEQSLIGKRWRAARGYKTKPLERYLARQVGRLWNDVFSEIWAALRQSRIGEAHGRYLLTSLVAIRVRIIDSEILWENWCGRSLSLSDSSAPALYVDPCSGRLHRNTTIETPRTRKKRLAAAKTEELSTRMWQPLRMRRSSPTRQLHLLADGNWWEVILAEQDKQLRLHASPQDVVLSAGLSGLPRETLYGRPGVFAVAKRSLSAKEIRRFGLHLMSRQSVK